MKQSDVIVIGAGAAGMMCAAQLGAKGYKVRLIDHAHKLAEKIRISGGGRCNFTNIGATWENYVSKNPRFARYALNEYTPQDFLSLLKSYGVTWHEKHRGQLFCDESSEVIIHVLFQECQKRKVKWHMPCSVLSVQQYDEGFILDTSEGLFQASHLVMATGGMAAPAIKSTDFGLGIARQFGLKVVEPRPALVPLIFDGEEWAAYRELAGISLEACIATGLDKKAVSFIEDILFTHKGLSGPGILQISSYWDGHSPLYLNLCPDKDLAKVLTEQKQGSKQQLLTVLSHYLPKRLAEHFLQQQGLKETLNWAEVPDKQLRQLALAIQSWQIQPKGTAGYKKAEAMRGGVDTAELNQKTMESKKVPQLYFIGEVVDITGWLGGYNFQWAWSSAVACARGIGVSARYSINVT